MINNNRGLVITIARAVARRIPQGQVDTEDLIGAGNVGLVQAAQRYDPARGPFSRFATPRIYGAIVDELRRHDPAGRIRPVIKRLEDAQRDVRGRGSKPDLHQVGLEQGLSLGQIRSAIEARSRALVPLDTLDPPCPSGQPRPAGDVLADPVATAKAENLPDVARVKRAMEQLPAVCRQVIVLYYLRGLSAHQVARIMGIYFKSVYILRDEAIQRLRAAMGIQP